MDRCRIKKLLQRALLLFLFNPLSAIADLGAPPIILIHDYFHEEQTYSIVTIIMRETESDYVGNYPNLSLYTKYVNELLSYLTHWVAEQYIDQGLIRRGDQTHKDLLTIEKVADHRSAIVFITEHNDLTKILSFMRVARLGSEDLPLKLRRPDTHLPPAPPQEVYVDGKLKLQGEPAEIKNFIQIGSAKYDFSGLMLWRAFHSGIMEYTFRKFFWEGKWRFLFPTYFPIETYPVAARHFKTKYGFEELSNVGKTDGVFENYLSTDLNTLYKTESKLQSQEWAAKYKSRSPIRVDVNNFKQILWEPIPVGVREDTCSRALTSVQPFFQRL